MRVILQILGGSYLVGNDRPKFVKSKHSPTAILRIFGTQNIVNPRIHFLKYALPHTLLESTFYINTVLSSLRADEIGVAIHSTIIKKILAIMPFVVIARERSDRSNPQKSGF